ncbi:MAG: hypothetical protein SH868_06125 [Bythopirellula sp.]|nr:hypothetical protein [Bythopirellula sp.]
MVVRFFALWVLVLCCSTSYAEDSVEIPLDQIWANSMPGTKKFSELNTQQPLVYEIREAIGFTQKDKDAKPAFAVLGTGLDALRGAHEVLVNKKKPRDTFPPGSEVSVVFFAHETQPYVHLHKVERQGKNINIYYRFVPHEEEVTERYIAIIPLGKLPDGKYRMNVIRSPDAGNRLKKASEEAARRIVCGSFSFTISEQGE